MRFSVLASGSGGNACYVETAQSRVMIDAGLSRRELLRRLELIDINPKTLDALIITHEHTDHVKGAGPLARLLDIPVYINSPTLKKSIKKLGSISKPIPLHTGESITINDLRVETFTKCHDAEDPIGLIICSNGIRLGLVTDLGRSTRLVEERLKNCHSLIMEFNYDPSMLEDGPYPLHLKKRIKGPEGHLSNQQAGELLSAVAHKNLQRVVLAHLSETNNRDERALQEARAALAKKGLDNIEILVSHQGCPTSMVELK
jgi:phosphoribosyl 1,2-cyclic phosphodiesterase